MLRFALGPWRWGRLLPRRGDTTERGLRLATWALGPLAAEFLFRPWFALAGIAVWSVFARSRRSSLAGLMPRRLPVRAGAHIARRFLSGCLRGPLTRPASVTAAASSAARSLAGLAVRLGTCFFGASGLLGLALGTRLFVIRLGRLTGVCPLGLLGASLSVASSPPPPST